MVKMAIKNSLIIIIVVQFFNCAGINYKKLSIENPAKLVAVQDSLLLVSGDNQRIRDALVTANNSVAKRYLNTGDIKSAVQHFNKSISIDGDNKYSKFGIYCYIGTGYISHVWVIHRPNMDHPYP